ncbi:hypothetical protein FLGE108171_02175 [Flavobacterium gelidilacus]|jgi:hypothetical protein|uniref:hypothetical protein n=1 Tax=Flavobacterium gelidilacus TaxID=206041 RepID=UPI00040CCBE4|nr:hypothetical protein [Flavobacterium gelidilacus]
MGIIVRTRKIRPSTRKSTSVNYRVDIAKVGKDDTLEVKVSHESNSFLRTYYFHEKDIAHKNNISFKVIEEEPEIKLLWSSAQPYK